MRYFLLLIFIPISTFIQANEHWFKYNATENTYSIDAKNVHPAAFLRRFSLNSGIEILYEKSISNPVDYYSVNGQKSEIISYLKKEYSTLLSYKKSKDNKETLTSISILPKGMLRSSNMIMAVNPIEESINFKGNKLSSSATPVYLTRLHHLESKVRTSIEQQADRVIKQRESRESRMKNLHENRAGRNTEILKSLELLKEKDPALYAAQKSILRTK